MTMTTTMTMNTPVPTRFLSRTIAKLIPALCLASSLSLHAQTAVPAPTAAMKVEDQIIELSPFSVTATKDQGYLAANTLAGSRLNTSLLDTPASISVMTGEFIADIGATSVAEALAYALNAEHDTSDITGNASGSGDLPLSIRGFGGASLGRNYFQWGLESDTYNTERLDFSRGPNSILFGTGGPGGIINTTTKRAQIGHSTQALGLRIGAWDDYRATFDINRQIGKKFAVRLNAVQHETKSWRDYVGSDRKGLALAATYRPFKNTEIRFDGEYGEFDRILSNTFLPADSVSPWIAGGRQISTTYGMPVTGATRVNPQVFVYEPITGTVQPWTGAVTTNSAGNAVSTTGRPRALTDFSIFPLKGNPSGDGNRSDSRFHSTALFLEQRLGDLWLEAAVSRQDSDRLRLTSTNWANSVIRGDANAFLPDGRPNPNVGKLYIDSNAQQGTTDSVTDDFRLTAAYTLDLNHRSPWLGSYSITGLLSRRTSDNFSDNLYEVNTTPAGDALHPLKLTHPNNFLYRRAYLDPFGSGRKGGYDARDHQFALNGVTSGFARVQNQGVRAREELDSRMVAAQAKILKDRLVLTGGLRHDRQKNFDGTATADAVTGLFSVQTLNSTSTDSEGDTKTFGAVLHLTKWVSAFYNKSDNFVPQRSLTILGTQLGPRFGKGEDYGFKFRLFGDRLYASVARYTTSEVNRLNYASGRLINIVNEIYEAIGDSTRVSGPTSRDSVDTKGAGYEFEVTANPTPQWRLTANFSQTEGIQTNNQPRLQSYIAERRAAWAAQGALPLVAPVVTVPGIDPVSGGPSTVTTALRSLDDEIATILGADGVTRRQLREYTGSVFSAYTFRSDRKWLNDFTAGLGVRYRGQPVVGYRNGTESIYGKSETLVNLMFAKTLRLRDRRVRLQANLDNVLNDNDPIIADADENGAYRFLYANPFRWTFSATINF